MQFRSLIVALALGVAYGDSSSFRPTVKANFGHSRVADGVGGTARRTPCAPIQFDSFPVVAVDKLSADLEMRLQDPF